MNKSSIIMTSEQVIVINTNKKLVMLIPYESRHACSLGKKIV